MSVPLHREQHWLYCGDRHPLYTLRHTSPEEIVRYRIAKREYWVKDELEKLGFGSSAASVDSMEAQLMLILSGAYIGFLPQHFAEPWLDRGRLRVLRPASFGYQAQFTLICRRTSYRDPLIVAFSDLVRSLVEEHADAAT